MATAASYTTPPERMDRLWLGWVLEGPYVVRRQHLVALDRDDGAALSTQPVGQQIRGLAKMTLDELQRALEPQLGSRVQRLAMQLAQGRPYRLLARDAQRSGMGEEALQEALMQLCRAGLVTVFCRNRRRALRQWEIRHVELTNWGRAVLISPDAVWVGPVRGRPQPGSDATDDDDERQTPSSVEDGIHGARHGGGSPNGTGRGRARRRGRRRAAPPGGGVPANGWAASAPPAGA